MTKYYASKTHYWGKWCFYSFTPVSLHGGVYIVTTSPLWEVKKSQEFVENSDSKRKRRKIEMFN
jgi:hypothetical protein